MSNTKQPTYEELMEMLQKERSKNAQLLKNIEEKDAQIANFKEVVAPILKEAFHSTSLIAKELNKYCFNIDDLLIKDLTEQIAFTADNLFKWANLAKSYFLQTPMAPTGKDLNGNIPPQGDVDLEKAKEEQANVASSLGNSITQISKASTMLNKVLGSVSEDKKEQLSETQQAAVEISKTPSKKRVEKAKTKSKGRVSKPRNPDKVTNAKLDKNTCHCGGSLESLGQLKDKLFSHINKAQQLLQDTENLHDAAICNKCGHVHIAISEEQNVPVIPNRQLSCETCIDIGYASVNGIPLNKFVSALGRIQGFGNDTFYYNMHDFADIYIRPLFDMVENAAKRADTIQVDETPFDCLEAQGKRQAPADVTSLEIDSKNYVLALTAPRFAKEQFCLYYYLRNRSKDAIKELINKDYKFKTICTDGYPGYDALLKDEHPNAKHQSCLIHFRREIIKAIDPKGFADELDELEIPLAIEKLAKDFKDDNATILLFMVLEALSKIYSYESSMNSDSEADFKARVECRANGPVRKLMDRIDTIMTKLSEGRIELRGSTYVKAKSDPFAKACTYYMNNRDKLRTFLDDGSVQADTNLVEGCIRPLTLLRKGIYHKVNPEYSKDMAMLFTVYQTAERVGIEDIHSYLRDYCHALFKHCYEKQWTQAYQDGTTIDKQIKSWDMKKLSEGFDFEKWNLVNYKQ